MQTNKSLGFLEKKSPINLEFYGDTFPKESCSGPMIPTVKQPVFFKQQSANLKEPRRPAVSEGSEPFLSDGGFLMFNNPGVSLLDWNMLF